MALLTVEHRPAVYKLTGANGVSGDAVSGEPVSCLTGSLALLSSMALLTVECQSVCVPVTAMSAGVRVGTSYRRVRRMIASQGCVLSTIYNNS